MTHYNSLTRSYSSESDDTKQAERAWRQAKREAQRQRSPKELQAWLSTSTHKYEWLNHACQAESNPEHARILVTLLTDSSLFVRRQAVGAIGKIANALPHLRRAAMDTEPGVASSVRYAAHGLPDTDQLELATLLNNHPASTCRGAGAAWAYDILGWPQAASLLYSWATSDKARGVDFYRDIINGPKREGMASVDYLMRLLRIPEPLLHKQVLGALAYVTLEKPREEATGKLWDAAFESVAQAEGDALDVVAWSFAYWARDKDENLLPLWQRTFAGKPAGPWQRSAISALMQVGTPAAHAMATDCALGSDPKYCDGSDLRALCRLNPQRFADSTWPEAYFIYIRNSNCYSHSAEAIASYCNHPDPAVADEARQLMLDLQLLPMSAQVAKVYLESTDPRIVWQALNCLFSGERYNQNCMPYLKSWTAQRPELLLELVTRSPKLHAESLIACFPSLDVRDGHGNTPLHLLAQMGDYRLVQKFLDAGADANALNASQQTHLDAATANKRWLYIFIMSPDFSTHLKWMSKLDSYHIDQLSRDEWLDLLRPMLHKPASIVPFFKALMRQEVLNLSDGGESRGTWDALVKILVMSGPGDPNLMAANSLATQLAERMAAPAPALPMPLADLIEAWNGENFIATSTMGRSIVFAHPQTRERRVLKVQKAGEPMQTLHEEANTLQLLHERRAHAENPAGIPLKSHLPQPLGVLVHPGRTADLAKWLPAGDNSAFTHLVGDRANNVGIYAYACDADYLIYATDVAPGAKHMWDHSLRDLFTLLDQGIAFPELANMFHNTSIQGRIDGGRYRALNSLNSESYGGGRLHNWRNAVEYPNLRGPRAELADFASLCTIAKAAQRHSALRLRLLSAFDASESTAATALRANFQAEALLTWELLLGRRAVDFNAWEGMAEELQGMYSHAVALCAEGRGLPAEEVQQITEVMRGSVDWERYAAQMQMFMTPQHAAYIDQSKPFPEGLFDIRELQGSNRGNSFHPKHGYVSMDGVSPSLGPVNGPNPIKAGEQARAMVVILDQLMAPTPRGAPLGTQVSRVTSDVAAMAVGQAGFAEESPPQKQAKKGLGRLGLRLPGKGMFSWF